MQRALALSLVFLAGLTACKPARAPAGPSPAPVANPVVRGSTLLSASVTMGDPLVASQLKRGFHQVEFGQWRWTEKSFRAVLRVLPKDKPHPQLVIRLSVPKPVIEHSPSLTISCMVDGAALPPETYKAANDYVFKRDITTPTEELAQVDCSLDNAIPAGKVDTRELGIIVWTISITSGA